MLGIQLELPVIRVYEGEWQFHEALKYMADMGFVPDLLVPDGVGQPLSLLRFYALHIVVVPLTVLLLTMLHFYRVRKNKGVLPYL